MTSSILHGLILGLGKILSLLPSLLEGVQRPLHFHVMACTCHGLLQAQGQGDPGAHRVFLLLPSVCTGSGVDVGGYPVSSWLLSRELGVHQV